MDSCYLDITRSQLADKRIDFVTRHQEIAGDGGFAVPGWLEADAIGTAERAAYFHPAFHNGITSRHTELIDATVCGAFDADDRIELYRIQIDCRWRIWIGR